MIVTDSKVHCCYTLGAVSNFELAPACMVVRTLYMGQRPGHVLVSDSILVALLLLLLMHAYSIDRVKLQVTMRSWYTGNRIPSH